jgi:flagellar hook assembly protein FlgD
MFCDSATYPIALDAGPRVLGTSWLSIGPGWNEMSSTVDANLYVVGVLTGNPVVQWLTVSPTSGTILSGQSQDLTLSFDISGLVDGNYQSILEIPSNDPNAEYKQVVVNLTVVTGIENGKKVGVMTFPNPATQFVNVKADANIDAINIYNVNGALVKSVSVNANSTSVNVNELSKGNYVMDIKVGNNTITRKVVVQ